METKHENTPAVTLSAVDELDRIAGLLGASETRRKTCTDELNTLMRTNGADVLQDVDAMTEDIVATQAQLSLIDRAIKGARARAFELMPGVHEEASRWSDETQTLHAANLARVRAWVSSKLSPYFAADVLESAVNQAAATWDEIRFQAANRASSSAHFMSVAGGGRAMRPNTEPSAVLAFHRKAESALAATKIHTKELAARLRE